MEDAASETSDWEVVSAASACGGDELDDLVVVSGGGGDVLPDHFTLALASPDAGLSGDDSWLEPEAARVEEYQREDLELLNGFDSISQESLDLVAELSSLQLQEGGVDENRESLVLDAAAACGASYSAEGRQAELIRLETEHENSAVHTCGELDCALQPLDSDATTATDASQKTEGSESYSAQLEDHTGVDACTETSCIDDSETTDEIQGGQAEQNQGIECDEMDNGAKDSALPLVQAPGTGEEGKQVVWWRLPFKLLHYCAWNVKPMWSFSIAVALLGLVVLGRKMYRMKRKAKGMPQIKIAFDDKRASQYANHAARLNEAFLIARRVPMLRTSSGAVLPWSMVQEK